MKISKLFHWLYALVMFLPILIFIPNVLYYGFNEHATNNDTYQINYIFETNEASNVNELYEGNIYRLDYAIDTNELLDLSPEIEFHIYKGYVEYEFDNFMGGGVNVEQPQAIIFGLHNSNPYMKLGSLDVHIDYFYLDNCYLTFYGDMTDFLTKNPIIGYNDFQMSEYNIIDGVTNSTDTITNKIYQGWQQVWDLPIFSWSHSTYFSVPFTYISVLFGFTADNSISYLLSYWFSISIIWLVFDVMIYVPLLAHRFLDKASLE